MWNKLSSWHWTWHSRASGQSKPTSSHFLEIGSERESCRVCAQYKYFCTRWPCSVFDVFCLWRTPRLDVEFAERSIPCGFVGNLHGSIPRCKERRPFLTRQTRLYVYTYIYRYLYVYLHINAYTYIYAYTCMCVYIYMYEYYYMCICTYIDVSIKYEYMYIWMSIYIYVYTCVSSMNTYLQKDIFICMHQTYTSWYMYTYVCIDIYTHTHVCVCAYTYVCIRMHIYTYIYIWCIWYMYKGRGSASPSASGKLQNKCTAFSLWKILGTTVIKWPCFGR